MNDAIEQAAEIIRSESVNDFGFCDADSLDVVGGDGAVYPREIAKALADAGLLATREEWGTRQEDEPGSLEPVPWPSREIAEVEISQNPGAGYTLHRRRVTKWEASE